MFSREDKRRALLTVLNRFMELHAAEIESGMTDGRLKECITDRMRFRVIWGGPGRFSGSCDPDGFRIFAGPEPRSISRKPILAGKDILEMARAEFEIANPEERQYALF